MEMKCHICGGPMSPTTGSVRAGWGGYELIVRGVKMHECRGCGERTMDIDEAQMVESLSRALHDSEARRPEVLNVEEVAEYLRVTPQTVYSMIKEGQLAATKIGREWRFRRSEVQRLLSAESDRSVAARTRGRTELTARDRSIIERHLEDMSRPDKEDPDP